MLFGKEMGAYGAEIYPFFVVQQHRMNILNGRDRPVEADFIDFVSPDNGLHGVFLPYINVLHRSVMSDPLFYVVYYDTLTSLFAELTRKLDKLDYTTSTNSLMRTYVHAKLSTPPFFTVFSDSFLITQKGPTPLKFLGYNLTALREGLVSTTERVIAFGATHTESLTEVESLLSKLDTLMKECPTPEEPVALLLDKNTAAPYRTLLYDGVQGLLKTPREQRAFFVDLLDALTLGNYDKKATLVERYGQPLTCAICHCETHSVDPLLMRAFCTEVCRTTHSLSLGNNKKSIPLLLLLVR